MNFKYFVNLALWLLEKPFLVWIKYSALYLPNITAGLADTQIKDKNVGLYKNSRCDTIKKVSRSMDLTWKSCYCFS